MNQLREASAAVDSGVLRTMAGGISRRAGDAAIAATRVRPVAGWRGPGSESAAAARHQLAERGRAYGSALQSAGDVLRRCADELEQAAQLRARSAALAREDTQVQEAAERARAVLRAATATGPPLPPYTWAEDTALLVAARRCAAEAHELEQQAVRRAAAALDELRPVRRNGASLAEHVVGFGRGAWAALADTAELALIASPTAAVVDPEGWWASVHGLGSGAAALVQDPRSGAAAAVGLDQLRAGAYGEWLGGMVAGAALPPMRGTRALGAVRRVDSGGPVRVRPGVVVPAGFPARIADLEPHRRVHILDGDDRGGGHRAGTGRPRKSEFPPDWTDDDIIERVMRTAMSPERVVPQDRGRFQLFAVHDGVQIKVILEGDGRVVSGYPIAGPGVVRNAKVVA